MRESILGKAQPEIWYHHQQQNRVASTVGVPQTNNKHLTNVFPINNKPQEHSNCITCLCSDYSSLLNSTNIGTACLQLRLFQEKSKQTALTTQ
jgi:hypothetical protein